MSFGIVATIGSAVIGGLAAKSAADSASKANSKAVAAQTQASQADIALAQEQRAKNEQLFSSYLGDENQAKAYLDAIEYGTGSYTPAGSNSNTPVTITRAQVMTTLQGTPLGQIAQQTYAQRQTLADQTLTGDNGLANQEYGDLNTRNDQNLTDANTTAHTNLTDRNTLATSNLDQRLTNNNNVYAAWDAQHQLQANQAVDQNFSRGGVTGLVGQTRAGVAQVGQQYALDAMGEKTQLDSAAYDPYFTDVNNAENEYATDTTNATDAHGVNALNITGNRANRNQAAYDTHQNAYSTNLNTLEGDEANNYGDYQNFLNGRTQTGFNARSQIAAGGNAYVNQATTANNNAANAIATGAYNRGAINQTLYGDLSGIVGNAYGSIIRPPKTTTTTSPSLTSVGQPGQGPMAPDPYSYSDPRLKRDVALHSIDPNGQRWWLFRYLWDAATAPLRLGVMATEAPAHAVKADANGWLMVDYSQLGASHAG